MNLKQQSEQESYNMILNVSKKNIGRDFSSRVKKNREGKNEKSGASKSGQDLKVGENQEEDSEDGSEDNLDALNSDKNGGVLNLGDKIAKSQQQKINSDKNQMNSLFSDRSSNYNVQGYSKKTPFDSSVPGIRVSGNNMKYVSSTG